MTKQHEIEVIAQKARSELEGDVDKIVNELWGKRPPDMRHLSEEEYLGFVRKHWPDVNFRQSLLLRVGPKHFLETYADAFAIPREVVMSNWLPPAPEGQTQPTAQGVM